MRSFGLVLGLCVLLPGVALAGGHAFNANFSVLAPSQTLADTALACAEQFRRQAALDWFGEPLPDGDGRVLMSIEFAVGNDQGLTWPGDGIRRRHHHLWLTIPPSGAIQHGLYHEIVHCVLNTKYTAGLPAWFEEGAASMADDQQRQAICRRTLDGAARDGRWPGLAPLLSAASIPACDQLSYAAASSFTQFLLTRGDRAKLLRFAVAGAKSGWDAAAQEVYSEKVADLETAWQAWAGANVGKSTP